MYVPSIPWMRIFGSSTLQRAQGILGQLITIQYKYKHPPKKNKHMGQKPKPTFHKKKKTKKTKTPQEKDIKKKTKKKTSEKDIRKRHKKKTKEKDIKKRLALRQG